MTYYKGCVCSHSPYATENLLFLQLPLKVMSFDPSLPFTLFSSYLSHPLRRRFKIPPTSICSYPLRVTKHPNQINGSKTWNRLHHVTKTVQDRAGFKETWVQRLKQWLRWESPWLGSGSSVVAPHLGSMWKTAGSSPDIRCSSTGGKKDYLFH